MHAVCSVAYEEDFVDEARKVGYEGGPKQFSGVIGVEEWYMRDSIDRKDGGGGRGIYCVVDVIIVGHDGFVSRYRSGVLSNIDQGFRPILTRVSVQPLQWLLRRVSLILYINHCALCILLSSVCL